MSMEKEEDNSCKNSLFFGLFDDSESRSGSMKRQYSDMGDQYHKVYEEQQDDHDDKEKGSSSSSSSMDMRVLMVLEYMRELYVGQLQILKKMFPGGAKDEFLGFFDKIGEAMSQLKQESSPRTKSMAMQRSLSTGSHRINLRGVDLGAQDLKNERFKVTTVDATTPPAGGAPAGEAPAGGGKGGQGQTKK